MAHARTGKAADATLGSYALDRGGRDPSLRALLDEDAEVMSNTQLEELLVGQPKDVQAEIIRINTEARPLALQVALIIPLLAGLIGLVNGFRMTRLPDPEASGSGEGMILG